MVEEKNQVTKWLLHQEEVHREGQPNHWAGMGDMTAISSNMETLRDAG